MGTLYLYPGRLHVDANAVRITTILGSCVSVGLWDARQGVGGMNHFMLPTGMDASPKYANHALPMLLDSILRLGAEKARLRACVFGGAVMAQRDHFQLGPRNIETALSFLHQHGIPLEKELTGGCRGRKIHFNTGDGSTEVKDL